MIEYNASFGYDKSLTIKYDPNFERFDKHSSGIYHGSSLLGLKKLADSGGYALVGCDSMGVNAFFVRKDVNKLQEIPVKKAFFPNLRRVERSGLNTSEQFDIIKSLDFEEVQYLLVETPKSLCTEKIKLSFLMTMFDRLEK